MVSWLDMQKWPFGWAEVSQKYPHEHGPTVTDMFITCRMVPRGGCFPSVTFAKASNCSIDFDYYFKKILVSINDYLLKVRIQP